MGEKTNILPTEKEIEEAARSYSFIVPYNGTNDFHDSDSYKHYKAGIDFVVKHVLAKVDHILDKSKSE